MASAPLPSPVENMGSREEASALRVLIENRFRCITEELSFSGSRFSLLRVEDTNVLLDAVDPVAFLKDERLPYWAEIWASSIALARWSLASPHLRGKRVLELGCGVGLAGIAAARAGANVILSDYEEDARLFARYNALQNPGAEGAEVLHIDWRCPPRGRKFDFVLGADILYERRHFLPLLEAFKVLLAPGGTVVLTDPDRAIAAPFTGMAHEWGFAVHSSSGAIDYRGKNISITRLELRVSPAEGQWQ